MIYKVFIDGAEGTTGLRLRERLSGRTEIELLEIAEADRKDISARKALIRDADVSFLCLPDEGAREIVRAIDAEVCAGGPDSPFAKVRIIDASTAHRVRSGWVYGMPELYRGENRGGGEADETPIARAGRVANPGCHATGFILSVRPLVRAGLLPADARLACHSLTGYSGGGKRMIAEYEAAAAEKDRNPDFVPLSSAPRQYGLGQAHKHLPEMAAYAGLSEAPVFAPVVSNFYSGLLVSVPLDGGLLSKASGENTGPGSGLKGRIHEALSYYYRKCPLVKVREMGYDPEGGFLSAAAMAGRDDLEIIVTGTDERVEIVSRCDNLGKGAAGAAIQNMNIMLGLPEETGLVMGA
ncbi:MAG: N-acetyl-gamma-glutamyl-phosphate reductase [Clostridiales Family XIII bacterium]|nr:N-acetyl-gamma-glutamyl-phosphate reductase [Clostridiales Family XIII bacterium]